MQAVLDSIRDQLNASPGEVRRLFHGRGRCYPGYEQLIIDLLPPVVIIRLFVEHDPMVTDQLISFFKSLDKEDQPEVLVIQHRYRRDDSIELVWNHSNIAFEDTLQICENGLQYHVRPLKNQNSGLFLDMREGRRWVQSNAQNKNVLNLFAYTCGFSVAAIAGGASKVVNLDMSRGALSTGRENHRLNNHPMERIRFLGHDLFRSWGRLKREGPYDLVIIDPPSFQKGSFVATKDYRKVLARMNQLTCGGARLLLCLNSPQLDSGFLRQLVLECCPEFSFVERIENPQDFPDIDNEQALKVLLFEKNGIAG